ncbi:MAG: hypothetical protein JNL11_20595 [Bdellovibrionaceae bacterium]|nr:hypothetical protein [Pseudobdellovibrionaceae bacterium]
MVREIHKDEYAVLAQWSLENFFLVCITFCTVFFHQDLIAAPDVLPKGINSPMFNYGFFQNLEQRFEGDGSLWKMGDLRSVQYDANYLSKVSPEARNLITALNAFGQSHGEIINYGILKFDINPSISYFAPIYARGITDNWTIGVGAPIVTYEVDVQMYTSHSNLESYKTLYMGRVNKDLDEALNLDIKAETLKTISQKGYKPLGHLKQQFLSDMQVVSIYRFHQSPPLDLFYLTTLGLPTGPAWDPDDLVALNTTGYSSIENMLAGNFKGPFGFGFTPYVGYQYVLPDKITARVPVDEEDTLPGAEQKDVVSRNTAGKWIVKSEVDWRATSALSFSSSYTQNQKSKDTFSGSGDKRYDLLGRRTNIREEIYSFKVTLSTVTSYFKKQSLFPYMVYYEFSDLFKGENVYRRTLHEVNFKMFF